MHKRLCQLEVWLQKTSLKCSPACQHCQGNCLNGVPQIDSEEEEDPLFTSLQESYGEDEDEDKGASTQESKKLTDQLL